MFGIAALAVICLLAVAATSAEAAVDDLYAAPKAVGVADCSSPGNACTIATAVTTANGEPVADSVRIRLARGVYLLSEPSPTALAITFAGPSLTLEGEGAVLSGTNTVRLLSIGTTSNVTIDGLEIELGTTSGLGGAIENTGTLTVKNSRFSSNTASSGGAITNSNTGTLLVENSTFSHNTTTGVGGGAILDSGMATIERSTINNNHAPINGGGINVQSTGKVTVVDSTIANNTSGSLGGGISVIGTVVVEASTIVNNSSTGGSAIASATPTNVTLAADILGPQSAGTACSPVNGEIVDAGYNIDVDGTCISPTSPGPGSHNGQIAYGSSTYGAVLEAYLAGGLAKNGGPTETVALLGSPNPATSLTDPAFGVVPGSFNLPAPIGGAAAACSAPDQRGVSRANPCDIGAFELPPTPPPPPPAPPAPKPTLSALKLAPKKLRDGQKGTISFKLDLAAKVTFQLKRRVRKHGKVKLVKSGGAPKPFNAAAGSDKRTWKPKGLAPGSYQLLATPAGGATATFAFRIVAKKRG